MKAICPICQKETEWEGNRYRPFCSERCKLADLGRWASGEYRIAAPSEEDEEKETPGQPDEEALSDEDSKKGKNGNPSSF